MPTASEHTNYSNAGYSSAERQASAAKNFAFEMGETSMRAYSEALLRGQREVAQMLSVNREFVDELQSLWRREQDATMALMEGTLSKLCDVSWPKGAGAVDPADANKLFDRALVGMREVGDAWVAAQMRMLERLRANAEDAAKEAANAQRGGDVKRPESKKEPRPAEPPRSARSVSEAAE